jgi:hypothetical protein
VRVASRARRRKRKGDGEGERRLMRVFEIESESVKASILAEGLTHILIYFRWDIPPSLKSGNSPRGPYSPSTAK